MSAIVVDGHRVITDEAEALAALARDVVIGFDLETSGLVPQRDRVATVQLYGNETGSLVLLHVRGRGFSPALRAFLERPEPLWVGHNIINFDEPFLAHEGVDTSKRRIYDTMVGEQVITVQMRKDVRFNLKVALHRRLGVEVSKDIEHSWMNEELTDQQVEYATRDVIYLPSLRRAQYSKAKELGVTAALDFEVDLMPAVSRMVINGIPIDRAAFDAYLDHQRGVLTATENDLARGFASEDPDGNALACPGLGEINFGSTQQLQRAFKERLNITIKSTNAKTLADLHLDLVALGSWRRARVVERLLEWKDARQRLNVYGRQPGKKHALSWWDEHVIDGRIHANLRQCGADTIRFTASDPNMQQVPRDMRKVFVARPGYKMAALDYSGIEVRVAAALTNDRALLEALGQADIHAAVAATAFGKDPADVTAGERQVGKALNFRMLFGGGYKNFWRQIRAEGSTLTLEETRAIVYGFFERFAGLGAARNAAYQLADSREVVWITLLNGAKRMLSGDKVKATVILNTPVQGNAGVGLKRAIALIGKDESLIKWLVLTVHDELVFEAPDDLIEDVANRAKAIMLSAMAEYISAPLAVGAAIAQEWRK